MIFGVMLVHFTKCISSFVIPKELPCYRNYYLQFQISLEKGNTLYMQSFLNVQFFIELYGKVLNVDFSSILIRTRKYVSFQIHKAIPKTFNKSLGTNYLLNT